MKEERVMAGLFGLCVGDALGVPVEFRSRESLKRDPVIGMRAYGTHHQPAGTWSDDSSLTFVLADSLCGGYDIYDIGSRCSAWYRYAAWTPHGRVFDIGITTAQALDRLESEIIRPDMAGMTYEWSNGNGSLMRVLPLAYWLQEADFAEKVPVVAAVSSITHRHERSIIACCFYVEWASRLLKGEPLLDSFRATQRLVADHFRASPELSHSARVLGDVYTLSEDEIRSSGYVIHTLEASIWCLFNSTSYSEAVLRAVNLGEDTDTTGAVTGGLAGIYYGLDAIPPEWLAALARREDIEQLARRLSEKLHHK